MLSSRLKFKVYDRESGAYITEGNCKECADALGMPFTRFNSIQINSQDAKNSKYIIVRSEPIIYKRNEKIYSVSNRDGKPIVSGSARDCAIAMGTSLHCFYSMVSKTLSGNQKKYIVEVYPAIPPQKTSNKD